MACGKRSKDRYGDQKIDRGWDLSCALNAYLCYENSLVSKGGRVVRAVAVQEEGEEDDPFDE
jgi:hypothetical protein